MGVLPGEPGVGAGFWTGRKNVSDCFLIHSFIHSKGRGVAYSARREFAALAFLLVLGSGLVQMLVTEGARWVGGMAYFAHRGFAGLAFQLVEVRARCHWWPHSRMAR